MFYFGLVLRMSDPVAKTFDLLGRTNNVHGPDLLIAALDVPELHIQTAALSALVRSGNSRGLAEAIRRYDRLPDVLRDLLRREPKRLDHTLRRCLSQGNEPLQRNALAVILECECYSQVATLLTLLETPGCPVRVPAAGVIEQLVNRLFDHCRSPRTDSGSLRTAETRHVVVSAICESALRFSWASHHAEMLECVLILANADDPGVRRVILEGIEPCRKLIRQVFLESTHPGVMQLICDYLSKSFPPPVVLDAFAHRCDPAFIQHLLRWLPEKLLPAQQKVLRQIDRVSWLHPERHSMAAVPKSLHVSLARLIHFLGLPASHKDTLRGWLVRNGSRDGREAAGNVLESMSKSAVQEIVFSSLDSDDADIQAWATKQLRAQGIPNALQMLVQKLDSNVEEVRFAAREELSGFNLERLLHLYPHLDPEVCARAGRLLLKIDPDTVSKLRRELSNPIRRKRIRAAQAAEALNLQEHVIGDLAEMLRDDDQLVRRAALEVLASVPGGTSLELVSELLNDPSPRVAETAAQTMSRLQQHARESQPVTSGERGS